MKALHRRADTV